MGLQIGMGGFAVSLFLGPVPPPRSTRCIDALEDFRLEFAHVQNFLSLLSGNRHI